MAARAVHGTLTAGVAATVQLDAWTDRVQVVASGADIYATVSQRMGTAPPAATVGGDDTWFIPISDPDGVILPTPPYEPGAGDQDAPVQLSLISAGAAGYHVSRL